MPHGGGEACIFRTGGRALAAWLMRGNHLRLLHRACALVFLLIAASLAAEAALARA